MKSKSESPLKRGRQWQWQPLLDCLAGPTGVVLCISARLLLSLLISITTITIGLHVFSVLVQLHYHHHLVNMLMALIQDDKIYTIQKPDYLPHSTLLSAQEWVRPSQRCRWQSHQGSQSSLGSPSTQPGGSRGHGRPPDPFSIFLFVWFHILQRRSTSRAEQRVSWSMAALDSL